MNNKLKILIILAFLIAGAVVSGIIMQPNLTNAEKELPNGKTTYHISTGLNELAMESLDENFKKGVKEKFGVSDIKNIKRKNAKVELTIHFKEEKSSTITRKANKAVGSISIGKRKYGFIGAGSFNPVVDPKTNETYYVGHINGEIKGVKMNENEPNYKEYDGNNSIWVVMFNVNTGESYVSTGVGFEKYTGTLIFGDINDSARLYNFNKQQMLEERNK